MRAASPPAQAPGPGSPSLGPEALPGRLAPSAWPQFPQPRRPRPRGPHPRILPGGSFSRSERSLATPPHVCAPLRGVGPRTAAPPCAPPRFGLGPSSVGARAGSRDRLPRPAPRLAGAGLPRDGTQPSRLAHWSLAAQRRESRQPEWILGDTRGGCRRSGGGWEQSPGSYPRPRGGGCFSVPPPRGPRSCGCRPSWCGRPCWHAWTYFVARRRVCVYVGGSGGGGFSPAAQGGSGRRRPGVARRAGHRPTCHPGSRKGPLMG